MKRKLFINILMIAIMLSLVACSYPASGQVAKSDRDRITQPNVDEAELAVLVDGNSAFAFDLYQALKGEEGNLFYSPYSISLALAMTYAGARGETAQQMADTLHFRLTQSSLHPAYNSLDIMLNSRGEGAKGKDGEGFKLNIVNAIWGQEDYEFLAEFLDTLAENYGAGIRLLDFIKDPEKSRVTINDWVSDNTEGRIEDLIPEGAITTLTRLVLTNAIYFNAAWQHPFQEDMTQDGPFHLLNGDTVSVPMMNQTEHFNYAEGDGYQAVELLYDGGELSMVILLPDADFFEAFEGSLDADLVNNIIDDLKLTRVALTMPKFTFDSTFDLKQTLSEAGMPDAFSWGVADFSGIDGTHNLFITDVFHQAFVSVDEAGTEAAAATAVIVGLTAAPEEPVRVTLDHPFIFLIRDIETGTVLFVGRIMNPGA